MADTLMGRIPRADLPPALHVAWDTLNGLTGEPAFVEVFAQHPAMLDFVMREFYGKIFFGGQVAERYKQLARLRLSMTHGCRTCNKQNVPGALAAGITQAQVDAIGDYEAGPFSEAEKAVLAYTDQVALTNMQGQLSPALYARLRAHFSDAELCELGVVMAVISGMAKLAFVLGLVEREPYCPFGSGAAKLS
ncbi:MAG: carboxymuconolactone decarboxylase family protein [Proteobacteria bacterium]|nr:carboxymuconolactone decarboxylase family protein [Pseudomonadota bacterium]